MISFLGTLMMASNFKALLNTIRDQKEFTLVGHPGPDGDCLGSMVALGLGLKFLGKTVSLYCNETVPKQFLFLDEMSLISSDKPTNHKSCLIVLDCSDEQRILEQGIELSSFTTSINIDHHPKNTSFANINYLDESKVATAELVYDILKALDIPLTLEMANCLYLGIVTDSGFFCYENTSPKTHVIAGELLETGVNPSIFKQNLEKKSLNYYKFLSSFLNKIKVYNDSTIAVLTVTIDDLLSHGMADFQQTDDLVDYLRNIEGVKIAILVKCEGDFMKFSFRSTGDADVGEICRYYGGGGHKKAAGFSLKNDDPGEILADVIKVVEGKINL
ncbi:bifunctional oligoribonuclease/PAP phosphatase NrnA [Proteinivorax hydrogeniformans]|uniref:Bifunctional oligoribonuclease/PAP phosphatase NrnA n=1 Tax=Proteinivorax hydrogeniformans TaxID=1826727 RepID=A0AAU8HNV5_9FIRM